MKLKMVIAALLSLIVAQSALGATPVSKPSPPAIKSPPPQGAAPPGAPMFLESSSASIPAGFRRAITDDAIRNKAAIFAAIKIGGDGDALGDGWINGADYGYQIMSYLNPSLSKGPFMYTSLPTPSGNMFQVIYDGSVVPYGYRLATCTEASSNLAAIVGWKAGGTNTSICRAQQGFVNSPVAKPAAGAAASCLAPLKTNGVPNCGVFTRGSVHSCQYANGYVLFPGVNVITPSANFDLQIKLIGNATALGAVCDSRVKCVGFDVDGNMKNTLPAYASLAKVYNGTCQGLYTPVQRAGCSLPGFTFNWSYDTPGGDYTQLGATSTRAVMAKACLSDSNCQGFNTAGLSKQVIQDRTQWTQWTTGKCAGLYVRLGAGGN